MRRPCRANFTKGAFAVSAALAALITLAAPPAYAEFVALRTDRTSDCSHRLPRAEALGVRAQCSWLMDDSAPLPAWAGRLDFSFGELTESQFRGLRRAYGGWTAASAAEPTYESQRSYGLVDFLPPVVQAVNGHRYQPEIGTMPDFLTAAARLGLPVTPEQEISLYWNCWGVTYEALRGNERSLTVVQASSELMLETLRNASTLMRSVSEPTEFPLSSFAGGVRPGDVVLILHKSGNYDYLDHTVVVLDDGIYFEKAGSGADVPIRITDEQTLASIWTPGVFRYELRRLRSETQLAPPLEVFSARSHGVLARFPRFAELPWSSLDRLTVDWSPLGTLRPEGFAFFRSASFTFDQANAGARARLPAAAYVPQTF